jgi:hypothetical protein
LTRDIHGKSTGIAEITFDSSEAAQLAIQQYHEQLVDGTFG